MRALGAAEGSTSRFGAGFKRLGLAAAAGGAAVAGAALVVAKKSVTAAISAQEANDKLTQAFKNQGIQMTAISPAVLRLEASQRKLGVSNADTRDSLLKLVNSGKSYALSAREMGVAIDLARVSGQDLGATAKSLILLQTGSTKAAKQYGIVLPPVTKNVDGLRAHIDALKKAHKELTPEEQKHELALAKVQDKLATGQAYYDALAKKVREQGDAFSKTAAGGIAQFHAQLGFLEEQLGQKLLPMFNQLLAWVSAHWPEISAIMSGAVKGVGAAIDGMVTAVQAIIPIVQSVVDSVRTNWPQISATFMQVFDAVKGIVQDAVTVVTALWNQFGAQILAQLRATWTFVQSYLQGVFNVIRGIFNVFGGLLHGDWSRVWLGLQQIFSGIWQQMTAVIRLALSTIVNLLTAAGRLMLAAVQGPWNAIKTLATRTFQGIVSAIRGVMGAAVGAARAVGIATMTGLWNGLKAVWQHITGWVSQIPSFFRSLVGGAGGWLVDAGRRVMQGFLDGLKAGWGAVTGFVSGIGGWISSHKGPPEKDAVLLFPHGKLIIEGLARGMVAAMPAVEGAAAKAQQLIKARLQATELVRIAQQWGKVIGVENAKAILQGFLQQDQSQKAQFITAARAKATEMAQAVTDAKGAFVSAFNDLANAALTAFDTRWAAWVPPAQRLLDKMNLAEQVKQVQDQLATAMTAVTGGGAFDASVLSKQLGESLATAMSTALGSIAGAKTEEALNRVSAQVQTQVLAAIDQTSAAATAQAAAAVSAAQTALTAAQATGDPAAITAAQTALDTAVGNQRTLEGAILAEKELALGQLSIAETKRHEAIGVIQREGLAKQLAELKIELAKHPGEWSKLGADVQKILTDYNVKLQTAGTAWANRFGDGIRAGIPAAERAAHALADAVAAILPSTSSPLKPAKKGPLSFHPRTMGKAWAAALGAGLASGGLSGIMDSMVPSSLSLGGGTVAANRNGGMVAAGAGGMTIYLTVNAETDDPRRLAQALVEPIRRELYRVKGRNGSLDF